jgi:hypothetical protein
MKGGDTPQTGKGSVFLSGTTTISMSIKIKKEDAK